MTGRAELVTSGHTEYLDALDACDWKPYYKALGRPTDKMPMERRPLLKSHLPRLSSATLACLTAAMPSSKFGMPERPSTDQRLLACHPLGKRHPT